MTENAITLLKRYITQSVPLKDIQEAYDELTPCLSILNVESLLVAAYENNHRRPETLRWLYEVLLPEHHSILISFAIRKNHMENLILCYNFCQENNIPFNYDKDDVFFCDDVKVLQWLMDNTSINYNAYMFCTWRRTICIDVALWWLRSGLPLILNNLNMTYTMQMLGIEFVKELHNQEVVLTMEMIKELLLNAEEDILEHLHENYKDTLEAILKSPDVINNLSKRQNKTFNLQWIFKKGLPFNYTEEAIDNLRSIDVAHFWSQSGLELKHTENGFYNAIEWNDIDEWWIENKLTIPTPFVLDKVDITSDGLKVLIKNKIQLEYTESAMDSVAKMDIWETRNFMRVWLSSGLDLKFTYITVNHLISNIEIEFLNALYNRGYDLPFTLDAAEQLLKKKKVPLTGVILRKFLEWWIDHNMGIDFVREIAQKLRNNELYRDMISSSAKASSTTDFLTEDLKEFFWSHGIIIEEPEN